MAELTPETLAARYRRARRLRGVWEAHWQDCYDFALPQRDGAIHPGRSGEKKTDKLFDATACDAVENLAASLMSQLTPPWSRWFGLMPGTALRDTEDRDALAGMLDETAEILQSAFDRSNFAVEMHQCFLDLVVAGTACLLFEEAAPDSPSPFRFTAVPLGEAVLEEGPMGRLDVTWRRSELSEGQIKARFPKASLPKEARVGEEEDGEARFAVIEGVLPDPDGGYDYLAILDAEEGSRIGPIRLDKGRFRQSPFINFRWIKAPGEAYGRSPVMKVLPDIKTANKVVELVLKNASIAVTGIWQADDDGVLNPATIKLQPGTIIPKAVGSSGLTPLAAPGQFDVGDLVLNDLRSRIRAGLLGDQLGRPDSPRMTATEVVERSAELARLLGATYGRMQTELLTPLVERGLRILRRRGLVPRVEIDGRAVELQYRSPLALDRRRKDAGGVLSWLGIVQGLGPEAMGLLDTPALARWLAESFGVPPNLLKTGDDAAGTMPAMTGAGDPGAVGAALGNLGPLLGSLGETLSTGGAPPDPALIDPTQSAGFAPGMTDQA